MLPADLKSELLQYSVRYPQEISIALRIIDFYSAHGAESFYRDLSAGHFTASGWILSPDRQKALLTHHRKLGMWIQIGGHADGCEDLREVAMKEAQEETGLPGLAFLTREIFDIDVHLIPARKDEPEHYHYDIRFLMQATSEDFVTSDESLALKWLNARDFDEVNGQLDHSVKRMHRKWMAFLESDLSIQMPLSNLSALRLQDSSNLS